MLAKRVLAGALAWVSTPVFSQHETPYSVIQATRSAIVQVRTNCGVGSGFFFSNEGDIYVMTNHHVVASAPRARCQPDKYRVETKQGNMDLPALVAFFDPVGDLAILKVFVQDSVQRKEITSLYFYTSTPRVSQKIVVWGAPYDEGIVPLDGTISNLSQVRVPVFETNVSAQPGNSGGPVIDIQTGQVVGVVTSRFQDSDDQAGVSAGRSLAVSVEYIRRVLTNLDWRSIRALALPPPDRVTPSDSAAASSDSPKKPFEPAQASAPTQRLQNSKVWIWFGFETALLRASALMPGIYGFAVAFCLLLAGRFRYTVLYGIGAYGLLTAGDAIFRSGAFMSAGQSLPYAVGPLFVVLGVLVVTHVVVRLILATSIFVTRGDAFDTRTERVVTGLLFRPWVSIALSLVLFAGAWVVIAWDIVWKAGN